MSFLLDIFKKSKKGNAFRIPETPVKYNDQIAALNSGGPTSQNSNSINVDNIKIAATYTANNNQQSKLPSA